MKSFAHFSSLIFLSVVIGACSYKTIPLKGKYTDGNYISQTDKTFDQVWDNIIDLFAQRGLPIKLIDRSSGLIISNPSSLIWSYEKKDGTLEKPEAWVAIYKIYDPGSRRVIAPLVVTGEWNIRIKKTGEKTSVNINLVNPSYMLLQTSANPTSFQQGYIHSTGNFERTIFDLIK